LISTTKEEAINLIARLPDEATWDDIMYEMYVKKKIELGISAANEGRVVSQEEVKKLFSVE
jgi:predicted transcriptional regulator